MLNKVDLSPQLWIFAAHSNNAQIIHLLEENLINLQIECKQDNKSEKNIEITYQYCLEESIKCHHNDVVDYFLNNYLQIDYNKSNIFINRCLKSYNFQLIQVESINENAFYYLCRYDYYWILYYILKDINIDINQKYKTKNDFSRETALFAAVENENAGIVKLLLTNDKINVNSQSDFCDNEAYNDNGFDQESYYKKTALYAAVSKENEEIVKLLLSNEKIDVNIGNNYSFDGYNNYSNRTALYAAVSKENVEIVKLLLSNEKIDVNLLNEKFDDDYNDKKTALYAAIEKENAEIVKLLLTNDKIDINMIIQDELDENYTLNEDRRKTALHLAIDIKNINIIKLLLSNEKTDINVKDDEGKCPIQYITEDKIKKILQNYLSFNSKIRK